MRALICDDDPTVRLIARRVLEEQFGCAIVECNDGSEALAALAHSHCDFALLDVDMPGMGGLETLEEIRASEMTTELPVVILTAERDEDTVLQLLQLGVSDYIVKPLRHSNFVAKMDALLRNMPRNRSTGGANEVFVGSDRPVLVVDGDAQFRTLLAGQIQAFGQTVEADSGAAAVMAFRKTPVDVVFIGSGLGVMSAERVAARLREVKPWGIRLVRIVDHAGELAGDQFDDVLLRSDEPQVLEKELRRFVAA